MKIFQRALLISSLSLLFGCTLFQMLPALANFYKQVPKDSPVEEFIEEKIEERFGLEPGIIDLSIFTPEEA